MESQDDDMACKRRSILCKRSMFGKRDLLQGKIPRRKMQQEAGQKRKGENASAKMRRAGTLWQRFRRAIQPGTYNGTEEALPPSQFNFSKVSYGRGTRYWSIFRLVSH